MIRIESENGWWLITHPDHARLAGQFAERWGNALFARPEPRASVLHGIHVHDNGWATRDAQPTITRAGKPAAFSNELVGRYSAFEEIDLADYLAVRERAVLQVEQEDPYAALLVSLHTYNLLTERADRSTIAPAQLPLLDAFLDRQRTRQQRLFAELQSSATYPSDTTLEDAVQANFRLLQAVDNLSLLSCVAYSNRATLLHPLAGTDRTTRTVAVEPTGERAFRLTPYPFDQDRLTFTFPARHVEGKLFPSPQHLTQAYTAAAEQPLLVTVHA